MEHIFADFEKDKNLEIDFNEGIRKLSDLAGITVYERLNASNQEEAKTEFLADESLVRPNNEYGNLDEREIQDGIDGINYVMNHISTKDWKQQKLADMVADYGLKEYRFLEANVRYNAAQTEEAKRFAAEDHARANRALYGEPDEDTFYAILREELGKINVDELSSEDRAAYEKMKDEIGPMKNIEGGLYRPKEETVARFSEMVNIFYEPFFKHVPEDKEEFTPDELSNIFNEILSSEFGDADSVPYHAVVTDEISNMDVNHETREIRIPKNAKPYSSARCKALLVHELGTHIMRALPYMEQDIEIFTTGLPGNETFDEGVAKCIEQAIAGKYSDSGREHYINIGLATFKEKNFREIYNIETTLKRLSGKKNNTTFNAVQRCFRGTGELPNNKDLAYYNGSVQVWKYIEENIDDPNLFDNLFLSGKANILDDDQSALVYEMKTGGIK